MYPPVQSQPQPMGMVPPTAPPPVVDPKMINLNQPTNVQNNNVNTGVNVVVGGNASGAKRKWTTGLCGCLMDLNACCCAYWCPPCYLCYLYELFDEGCCAAVLVPNALMALRVKLRTQHNIEGSILMDCCTSCCCTMCVMCQLKRERDNLMKQGLGK